MSMGVHRVGAGWLVAALAIAACVNHRTVPTGVSDAEAVRAVEATFEANDRAGYLRAATRLNLRMRAATDEDLWHLLNEIVAAQARGSGGLQGAILSGVAEARARGVPADRLAALISRLRDARPTISGAHPVHIPITGPQALGAVFVRAGIVDAAWRHLLIDPSATLDDHFAASLCDMGEAALAERLGNRVAQQIRLVCERSAAAAPGNMPVPPFVAAMADFDCLLAEAGEATSFADRFQAATRACAASLTQGGGNPLASGPIEVTPLRVAREVTGHSPDGADWRATVYENGDLELETDYPDGRVELYMYDGETKAETVIVRETDPIDGHVTTTTTRPDGSVTVTREFADGSSETTRTNADGSVVATTTDANGVTSTGNTEPPPGGGGGSGGGSGGTQSTAGRETPACLALGDLVNARLGKTVGLERPSRDPVSHPSPEADSSAADACLSVLAPEQVRGSALCNAVDCSLGEVLSTGCRCTRSFGEVELPRMNCATLRCVDGTQAQFNRVCTCQLEEREPPPGNPSDPRRDPHQWLLR